VNQFEEVVIGVDSSTQACKVEVRTLDGKLLGRGRSPHPPAYPPASEQEPAAWWSAFCQAIRQGLDAANVDGGAVVAIGIAAQCHGLVALDSRDEVIRPAKLYNDTTSAAHVAKLTKLIGAEAWIKSIGSLPTAAFTIGKLAWLATEEPPHFASLRTVLLPHDWLTFQLTGRKVTDRSDASGTGYFEARTGQYRTDYLSLIDSARDWDRMLPDVLAPSDTAGRIQADVARDLGINPRAVVSAGGGDQHAAALGLAIRTGDVAYSLGTSGVVYTSTPDPVTDLTGIVDGVANMTGGYLPLVSTLNAARVTDQFARLLGVDHAGLDELALTAEPRAGSEPAPLVLAAHLDGERKPNRPGASGILAGITSQTSRADIARAAIEGVLLGLDWGESCLHAAGVPTPGRLVAIGGGARSQAYLQLLADLTQRTVHMAEADEATASGAAVQAAAAATGLGVADTAKAWAPEWTPVAWPREEHLAGAEQASRRYEFVVSQTSFDCDRAQKSTGAGTS
jgi:xylulokinase